MHTSVLTAFACAALVSAKTCTYVANFDNGKPTYKIPEDGYKNLKWRGDAIQSNTPYVVLYAGDDEKKYSGGSKPNALAFGNSFSLGSTDPEPSKEFEFKIKSFDAACVKPVPHVVSPIACSIILTDTYGYDEIRNTTQYDIPITSSSKPEYIHFKGPSKSAINFLFQTIGKPLATYDLDSLADVYLDNIVLEQPCKE